ncbi:MAG TPA: 1-(5-phosphoribosyl)-5-[(5-phosphoribosylamino)methylideneamino]imidazole-4-carboxamide isomerase [Thermoflexales bacterium]|nr:1-(5-phosphoribosyl)-5-[(5-phosphoribosylamino)methylideneamino]imidazole-4-carboxamide isomerase [Thermoflexales bacterium]HQW34936.1 1-(5-phosphoribosyl)-5-[(5-phosphoribosylamino)methylideneamino]imidazole-4-carboxamide isomerase [Thermoflexales bacterium]HQZ21073.1 1-(5-phosphoribosyl)-5-[(5-phosphoribosylamino)methylideneamino]imidazole-4-carboxamide isomerase [Thermoflexales bacterium]HQZ99291.1 1-(5-phosphoribosyl)-5-[(5-phosphoribosylamino)methylideneamino]imidazole-4-carboxamide isom
MFTIYPAIDLRNGQVVRLRKGDPNQQTTYSSDPVAISQKWQEAGAEWVHVVNLDGAFGDAATGRANRSALSQIARATSAKVQFGGGLRAMDDLTAAFDAGAARVVLGTAAAENPRLVADALARFGAEQIVAGLDSRAGMIVTRGWQTQSQITAGELGRVMREMGVVRALYTEVDRDGMMIGSAAEYTSAVAQLTDLKVIASGGIGKLDDIRELLAYEPYGVEGVIVGRALYEGAVDLREALDLARRSLAS